MYIHIYTYTYWCGVVVTIFALTYTLTNIIYHVIVLFSYYYYY